LSSTAITQKVSEGLVTTARRRSACIAERSAERREDIGAVQELSIHQSDEESFKEVSCMADWPAHAEDSIYYGFYHAELVYIQFDLMQMGTQQRTDTEKACNAVSNT
jgi:hypothetical protein